MSHANAKPTKPGVRAIVHVSPSVYVAGLLAAQRRSLSQREFVDAAIARACSDTADNKAEDAPWSASAMALFVQVVDSGPHILTGQWRVLLEKVVAEPSLWQAPPSCTVDEIARFMSSDGWCINEQALTKAWPRLVSSVFCM